MTLGNRNATQSIVTPITECDVFRCAVLPSTLALVVMMTSLMTVSVPTVIAETGTDKAITKPESEGVNAAFLEFLGLVSELDEVGLTTESLDDVEQGASDQTLD